MRRLGKYFVIILVSFGCARVPKEAVQLSDTVGKDLAVMWTAHTALVRQHFGAMRENINEFVDYTYRPFIIEKTIEDLHLVDDLQAAAAGRHELGLGPMDVMEIYVEETINQIETFRSEMVAPINEQETELLASLDASYSTMINANATVTAHLRSVIKVHEAQEEALSHVGLDDRLRDKISGQTARFSTEVNHLLEKARSEKQKLDDLPKKLREITTMFKSVDEGGQKDAATGPQ